MSEGIKGWILGMIAGSVNGLVWAFIIMEIIN